MDRNKAKVLEEIGYQWNRTCGTCDYVDIRPGTNWGVCMKFTYTHRKHHGPDRQLSVNRYGGCEAHVANPVFLRDIAHFTFGNDHDADK